MLTNTVEVCRNRLTCLGSQGRRRHSWFLSGHTRPPPRSPETINPIWKVKVHGKQAILCQFTSISPNSRTIPAWAGRRGEIKSAQEGEKRTRSFDPNSLQLSLRLSVSPVSPPAHPHRPSTPPVPIPFYPVPIIRQTFPPTVKGVLFIV